MSLLLYSNCNTKITRLARTIILNMQSATDCTSKKLGLCQLQDCSKCYAYRSELRFTNCLPYRRGQARQWQTLSVETYIKEIEGIQKRAFNKYQFLRFSEAGDYSSISDVHKMLAISGGITIFPYTYTARKDLFYNHIRQGTLQKSKLVINGSGFMIDNCFKVVGKGYKLKAGEVLCKGKCEHCTYCMVKGKRTIVNVRH